MTQRRVVTGTLRHVGGVDGIAWHFARPGWSVGAPSPTGLEVTGERCAFLLEPGDGDEVLLSGDAEPEAFEDLAATLRGTGARVTLALFGGNGAVERETSVTREEVDAAERERYERDLATLVGLRVLDVTYHDIDIGGEPDWDHGDWHHAVMGVELHTDDGVVSVTWTNTFDCYGVEAARGPLDLVPGSGLTYAAGDHPHWLARRGPVRGVATWWDEVTFGEGRTSSGVVPMPERTVAIPYAIRLDFDAGPVWFVAATPVYDGSRPPYVGGDEVMVVFAAERMVWMGFPEGTF